MSAKARIDHIGTFNDDGQPVEWSFDHTEQGQDTAAIDIQEDGSIIYSGYTVAELREIAQQPK